MTPARMATGGCLFHEKKVGRMEWDTEDKLENSDRFSMGRPAAL